MLRRTLTALVLLLILLPIVFVGGVPYFLLVAAFVVVAAREYTQMYALKGFHPSAAVVMAAVFVVLGSRAFRPDASGAVVALAFVALVAFHLVRYEVGRETAPHDLVIALAGVAYLGWVAAYLLDLRLLPNGAWWLLLVFIVVWVADSTAYFVGSRFGLHKMTPRLSPKKSWEGYLAGVVAGTAASALLTAPLARYADVNAGLLPVLGLGFLLSTLTTLGDLAESLFKRYAGIKDSGSFLPGHGGAFDRIDSLIWAGLIGYVYIRFVML